VPGLNHLRFPLKCFGSIFAILNLLLWTEVPLTVYYNIARAETLKLPYSFAKPAYDPLIRIGNLFFRENAPGDNKRDIIKVVGQLSPT